jgi:hypothetical protein
MPNTRSVWQYSPFPLRTPEPPPKYKQLRFFDPGFGGAPKNLLPLILISDLESVLGRQKCCELIMQPWYWYYPLDGIGSEVVMIPRHTLLKMFGKETLSRLIRPRGVVGAGVLTTTAGRVYRLD